MATSEVKQLLELLTCPIHYTHADTSLFPCLHKVSELAAAQLQKTSPASCPTCRKNFTDYKRDDLLVSLSHLLTSSIPGECSPVMDQFKCPVEKKPLTEAIALIPCGHRVNKAARKAFQKCPVCKASIQSVGEDHTIREIAKLLFGQKDLTEFFREARKLAKADIPEIVTLSELQKLFKDSDELELKSGASLSLELDSLISLFRPGFFGYIYGLLLNRPNLSDLKTAIFYLFNSALYPRRIFLKENTPVKLILSAKHAGFTVQENTVVKVSYPPVTLSLKLLIKKMQEKGIHTVTFPPNQQLLLTDFDEETILPLIRENKHFQNPYTIVADNNEKIDLRKTPEKLLALSSKGGIRLQVVEKEKSQNKSEESILNLPLHALQ